MAKRDYYEVLGVDKNADDAAIKKAYRPLAKKNHPDVNPGDKEAEERFKEINEAYQVLSNPQKRAQYDQFGHDGPQGFGGGGYSDFSGFGGGGFGGFEDIFSSFFGGGAGGAQRNGPVPGDDLRYEMKLTFEEDAIEAIAKKALERKTGARGLRSIMENALMDVMYRIPSDDTIEQCIITKDTIENASEPLVVHREEAKKAR